MNEHENFDIASEASCELEWIFKIISKDCMMYSKEIHASIYSILQT